LLISISLSLWLLGELITLFREAFEFYLLFGDSS